MTEILAAFVRANIAVSLAILVVIALRIPARRIFGAQVGYALWLAAPLAFVASILPAAEAETAEKAAQSAFLPRLGGLPLVQSTHYPELWAVGAALALLLVGLAQVQFMRRARSGRAGPALVGVICPRIVTPSDYGEQFSEDERALIRAHERAHMDRGDTRVNAAITAAQCLCWFNPLVHLAAHLARLDQELACDATVMQRRPGVRKLYAATMLKTQLATSGLPLGCHWVATARHPLEERIGMLARPRASENRRLAGAVIVGALVTLTAAGAWAAKPLAPPHEPFVPLSLRPENCKPVTSVLIINIPSRRAAAHS